MVTITVAVRCHKHTNPRTMSVTSYRLVDVKLRQPAAQFLATQGRPPTTTFDHTGDNRRPESPGIVSLVDAARRGHGPGAGAFPASRRDSDGRHSCPKKSPKWDRLLRESRNVRAVLRVALRWEMRHDLKGRRASARVRGNGEKAGAWR